MELCASFVGDISTCKSQWFIMLLQMITSNPSLTVTQPTKKRTAQWIIGAYTDEDNDEDDAYLSMSADTLHGLPHAPY
ncbi:predicted protein [Lichtheimia corymbifera JMRC:FSU:9682]|uniref:Uncharacterized protein n=1 Tax=Lichtheimia corymbifera JMRC:FSU:9682 TaxID=1263082 RepID=A0A068RPL6_9FUNG|nr:predicted protein [Lichtheimia corymbifera JMRC:FSU:9682]